MKPTVFLSHSSRDELPLRRLRQTLEDKTSGAVRFFLSSDGQSIPLGRNWVHEIQEALDQCKLMLVFLSPRSIGSRWVHFESGFAYSKQIRVVPVGVLGVDLNDLTPPLSLLQGFNVRSGDGLNNILALINDAFDLTCKESFTAADYDAIFGMSSPAADAVFGPYTPLLDSAYIDWFGDPQSGVDIATQALKENNASAAERRGGIGTFGLMFFPGEKDKVRIQLDPSLFAVTAPLVEAFLATAPKSDKAPQMVIRMMRHVRHLQDDHKITARLFGTGTNLLNGDRFEYHGLNFSVGRFLSFGVAEGRPSARSGAVYISVDLSDYRLDIGRVRQLVEMLFERQILMFADSEDSVP